MSREIKCRVYSKRLKAYTDYHTVGFSMSGELQYISDKHGAGPVFADDYIVEQCTGLKDANGEEIYEGDVIRYKVLRDDCSARHGYKYREVIGVVRYDDKNGEYITGLYSNLSTIANHYEPEVIGNVHENEDWLGGKK